MRSSLLERIAGGLLPVQILFAASLLLRGHDAPGGGFVAGLVTASAVLLAAIAFGRARVERALAPVVAPLLPLGLALAAASGMVAVLRGESFLTHYHLHLSLSPRASLHLSTAQLFDVGVYLVVIGAAAMILDAFAEGARR